MCADYLFLNKEYWMQAAELIAPRTFQLTDMPVEDPGPGEVQVRIEAVGVCGSDLHAYSEGAVGSTPNVYPMVLGHGRDPRHAKARYIQDSLVFLFR